MKTREPIPYPICTLRTCSLCPIPNNSNKHISPWMWTSLCFFIDWITPRVPYKIHCIYSHGADSVTRHSLTFPHCLGTLSIKLQILLFLQVMMETAPIIWWGQHLLVLTCALVKLMPSHQFCPEEIHSWVTATCSNLLRILCKSQELLFPDSSSLVLQLDTYSAPITIICLFS